jgi:hypothetical protein
MRVDADHHCCHQRLLIIVGIATVAACLISFLTARASFEPATARPHGAGTSFVSQTVTGRQAVREPALRGLSTLRPNRNAYMDSSIRRLS